MKKRIKVIALSVGATLLIAGILLSAASFIVAKMGVLPEASLSIITTVVGAVAVFIGSFLASLYNKEKGMLFGILNAAICCVIFLTASICFQSAAIGIGGGGKIVAFLISGSIGGILGVNRKRKVKF